MLRVRLNRWISCVLILGQVFAMGPAAFAHDSKKASADSGCEEGLQFAQGIVDLSSPTTPGSALKFTAPGLKRIQNAQENLKVVTNNFNTVFEAMNGVLEMSLTNMGSGNNAIISGPPGAGKSAGVTWLVPRDELYYKQLHEMMIESSLFGGQTEAGMKAGREEINREGTIIQKSYFLLDEVPNANPQLAASLLAFLQPEERGYSDQGELKKAEKVRAGFMTGNATMAQMLAAFMDRGMFSGAALLNRALFKAWVPNWLRADEQERRDQLIKKVNFLKMARKGATKEQAKQADEALKKLETRHLDMDAVEVFAEAAFTETNDLNAALRKYVNLWYERINGEVKQSDQAHRDNSQVNPLVLTPSAEWTERYRSMLMKIIKVSVALDYLRATEAKDIAAITKPIPLNPSSIWRIMYVATTVGPGINHYDPDNMQIEFNLRRKKDGTLYSLPHDTLINECKDLTEESQLNWMWKEQDIFNEFLKKVLTRMSGQSKAIAAILDKDNGVKLMLNGSQDVEAVLARLAAQQQ